MKTPDYSGCALECIRSNKERECIKTIKGVCPYCESVAGEANERIQQLESRLAQVERERDAAVADCSRFPCATCSDKANGDLCHNCNVRKDTTRTNHEWRGVCAENTKED